jgi:glycosyltransferase involved in cell wall biosynthesis
MKKILIFSLAYYPKHVGGAEVAIKEKTDRITDIEFHMVTLRYDSTLPRVERVGNVLVHRIGFSKPSPSMADLKKFPLHYNKVWFQFAAAFKALALYREYRYDATWAMMAHSCGIPAALFKVFRPRVPFILELQEGDPPEYIERLMRPLWPLFSRAFTSVDVVSVISTFLGNWARRRGFKGPIELVPNAVDIKHFSQEYPQAELDEIKTKLDKRPKDIFIITTSRLVHKNAVDNVIQALPGLPPNIFFLVLGIGPDEIKLKKLALDLGVMERVKWLGQIQHKEMPKYLKASDIFIRPSRSEGMGNSFVEAMAAGLPVIATQEGGIADFLFDAKRNPEKLPTGWAVDVNSSEQITRTIIDILANPEAVQRVVENAREMVIKKYDWDLIARDMREKVFARVLKTS